MPIDHTKNIIEIENLSYSYPSSSSSSEAAVDNISFNIHQGDYLGLIGPNGGGKTTLIKLILGLLSPTAGQIKLFGQTKEYFTDWSKIGYVAQKATLIDPLFPVSVYEVVSMGGIKNGIFGQSKPNSHLAVETALQAVGMVDLQNRLIGDLSGGQQQRVFIARALVSSPKLIILDEPTSGVDSDSQLKFYHLLKKLNHDMGITLVLVSHDIDVVTREVTEIAAINHKLVYYGETNQLTDLKEFNHLYPKGLAKVPHHV